jgi:hypothetical protein
MPYSADLILQEDQKRAEYVSLRPLDPTVVHEKQGKARGAIIGHILLTPTQNPKELGPYKLGGLADGHPEDAAQQQTSTTLAPRAKAREHACRPRQA